MTSDKFWSDLVGKLNPYVPGEQPKLEGVIKLNTNENPYGPSPKVSAAISAVLGDTLRLYPDPNSDALKQAIASYYQVDTAQVFVGNGSDEVLAHTFQALLKHELPILFPDISYSFYPVYCGLYKITYEQIPVLNNLSIDLNNYKKANGGIIFPNPNAPTGRIITLSEIANLLENNSNSVVVVDEAYIDFGGDSAVALIDDFPNLLVTQTLSKSRSLAGLRVGFAIGHAGLIEALERVKNSFNSYPLDRLAIAGAVAAIDDEDYFQQARHQVIESREQLVVQLKNLGFSVIPSAANFVFITHPSHDATVLATELRSCGIIVRHFKQPRIEQFLRITVGLPMQNQQLVDVLKILVAA